MRETNARFDVPLRVMTLLRVVLMLGFIFYTLGSLYSLKAGYTASLALVFILVFMFSKNVRKRMRRIESKFLDNLNERELRRSGRNNKLVSDMHLAYVTVGYDCPFVGEQLKDSQLHRKYGINVATIQRGNSLIPVPGGNTRIFPGDVLAIIGSEDAIQRVLPEIERQSDTDSDGKGVERFKLRSIQLTDNSPLIGKTILDSGLRDKYQSLLVAVRRGDDFITGSFTTPFEAHDTLWLVGDPAILASLR